MGRGIFISYRRYRRMLVGGGGATLVVAVLALPFTLHLWKGWRDAYGSYSGLIVEKGSEFHLLGPRVRVIFCS